MPKFQVLVYVPNTSGTRYPTNVIVEAPGLAVAKSIAVAQYGEENVKGVGVITNPETAHNVIHNVSSSINQFKLMGKELKNFSKKVGEYADERNQKTKESFSVLKKEGFIKWYIWRIKSFFK